MKNEVSNKDRLEKMKEIAQWSDRYLIQPSLDADEISREHSLAAALQETKSFLESQYDLKNTKLTDIPIEHRELIQLYQKVSLYPVHSLLTDMLDIFAYANKANPNKQDRVNGRPNITGSGREKQEAIKLRAITGKIVRKGWTLQKCPNIQNVPAKARKLVSLFREFNEKHPSNHVRVMSNIAKYARMINRKFKDSNEPFPPLVLSEGVQTKVFSEVRDRIPELAFSKNLSDEDYMLLRHFNEINKLCPIKDKPQQAPNKPKIVNSSAYWLDCMQDIRTWTLRNNRRPSPEAVTKFRVGNSVLSVPLKVALEQKLGEQLDSTIMHVYKIKQKPQSLRTETDKQLIQELNAYNIDFLIDESKRDIKEVSALEKEILDDFIDVITWSKDNNRRPSSDAVESFRHSHPGFDIPVEIFEEKKVGDKLDYIISFLDIKNKKPSYEQTATQIKLLELLNKYFSIYPEEKGVMTIKLEGVLEWSEKHKRRPSNNADDPLEQAVAEDLMSVGSAVKRQSKKAVGSLSAEQKNLIREYNDYQVKYPVASRRKTISDD